jgi:hypothetical protein
MNVIDGRVNPEMIQDRDAYRLFFLAVSSQEQVERQDAMLAGAKLSELESPLVRSALADFKSKYEKLVDDYNRLATAAEEMGQVPNTAQFVHDRDALVLSTKDKIEATLSPSGMARFQGHVSNEKHGMKVALD